MYKPEDIRKDQIIIGVIHLMDAILHQEKLLDLSVVTYRVLPTSTDSGLVEFVPSSETMANISHADRNAMRTDTLFNWIIAHNLDVPPREIRRRLVQSTAACCVITYLLGIGAILIFLSPSSLMAQAIGTWRTSW